MEGSSNPESEPSIPEDTEENQPESQKKKLSLPKKLAIASTAGLAALAGAVGFKAVQHNDEGTETPITQTPAAETFTPEPTAESTQVVEITPTPIEKTPTPQPTESPTPTQEETVYSSTRSKIENEQIPQEEKTRLTQALENLQQTSTILSQFENAYIANTETDGTPALLKLTQDRFANINFSQSSGTKDEAVKQHLQEEIFFLKDISEIKQFEQKIASAAAFEEINNILSDYQQNYNSHFTVDYAHTEFGEKSPTVPVIDVDPSMPASKTEAVNDLKNKIVGISNLLPNIGEVKFYISATAGGNFDSETGIVRVSIDDTLFKDLLEHEYLGHYSDIAINPHILNRLTPEEIVNASITRESIINRFYQDFTEGKVISPQKQEIYMKVKNGQTITADEAFIYASTAADTRMVSELNIFDNANGIVEIQDASYSADKTVFYEGWNDFVLNNKALIDSVVEKHPNLAPVISDIQLRPDFYDSNYWSSVYPHEQKFGPRANAKSFFSALTTIARIDFFNQVLTGKFVLTQEQWGQLLYFDNHKITGPGQYSNGPEVFAQSMAQTIKIKDLIGNFEESEVGRYLENFQ